MHRKVLPALLYFHSVSIQGSGKLIVNGKGSDSQLVSNLLDEIKALV